ncbi:hypothetical protein [Flexivirga caeni]|uniref:hypothetical protein n=1 Tax=Flexivirga caeni TaxID=2294115 RepID=UPI0015E88DF6|nr:hypothetical protein [Flexivirga caeni]
MALPVFDFAAFTTALNARRQQDDLGWYDLADQVWDQSAALNARRPQDHPMCGGAIGRLATRGETSCQYALFLLRWLDRAPEDFLTGEVCDVGTVRLPRAGTDSRLRWDLPGVHAAMNDQRQAREMTWADLADVIGCTPSRLTNLRSAKQADLALVMRVTQWLQRPSTDFIRAVDW